MRLSDLGKFVISEQIVGIMLYATTPPNPITMAPSDVHWFSNYSVFYYGHKKDIKKHLSHISTNIASVLVF